MEESDDYERSGRSFIEVLLLVHRGSVDFRKAGPGEEHGVDMCRLIWKVGLSARTIESRGGVFCFTTEPFPSIAIRCERRA